jgi:hypothetical protein
MNPILKRAAALAAGLLAFSAQATTVTFDSLGDSFTFLYGGNVDGATMNASVTYTLTAWNNRTATMSVSATNNSTGTGRGLHPIRLVAFGVAFTTPDLTNANVAGIGEWDADADTQFDGSTVVQLCEYAGANCLDDTGLGVWQGDTDTFDLSLTFASRVEGRTITFGSPFESKWQGVGNQGLIYGVTGCLNSDTGCVSEVNQIPEPTTLALGGLALLGAAAARRRQV